MAETSAHAAGTPSWVDLRSDVAGATAFYCPLFGWEAEPVGTSEITGDYGFFTKNGEPVAGFTELTDSRPPRWTVYFATVDADETAALADKAGGRVLFGPVNVLDQGRILIVLDPAGAAFGVWEPEAHPGAGLVRDEGAVSWVELDTTYLSAARDFYPKVFGWGIQDHAGSAPYTEWTLDGVAIGGLTDAVPPAHAGLPSFWLPYFGAADADALYYEAARLGGTALVSPTDYPGGRFAVIQDPYGAMFGLFSPND